MVSITNQNDYSFMRTAPAKMEANSYEAQDALFKMTFKRQGLEVQPLEACQPFELCQEEGCVGIAGEHIHLAEKDVKGICTICT